MFAEFLPPVMLGSLTAILLSGTLNFVGKRYPHLTGEDAFGGRATKWILLRKIQRTRERPDRRRYGRCRSFGRDYKYLMGVMCHRLFRLCRAGCHAVPRRPREADQRGLPHRWGRFRVYKFFSGGRNISLLFAIGVSMTPWDKLIAAFNLPNLITIVSTVATLMAIGALVGRWLNMYPIEAAIINACHSGQGGTGDVAILTAANRMQLMPFAQIATRIGGAITVTAVLILLSRLI
jgi:Na+/citrate or Na+/malate symporter